LEKAKIVQGMVGGNDQMFLKWIKENKDKTINELINLILDGKTEF
jgi:hypothetical protein